MQELLINPDVEAQTSKAIAVANDITITDQPSYEGAATALANVKAVAKTITAAKDAIVKPLNDELKRARDAFRPFELNQQEAEAIIKRKMIAYRTEVEAEARKREEALRARVERGTMKAATAVSKAEEIEHVQRGAGESYRKVRKMRIVDLKKIPAQYFIVDEVALRRDALAIGGVGEVIPGCEVYEETTLAL
jgi:hypothetical protein